MQWHDIIIAFIGYVSEVIGTVSGAGSSTYFVPLASLFEDFTFVITLTAFLHSVSNLFKIHLFRRTVSLRELLRYALPSVLFCGLGALLVPYANLKILKIILGVFLMVISILKGFEFVKKARFSNRTNTCIISISGFLTGLIGTGGALRAIALSHMHITKEAFVLLSSTIDIGGDLLRLVLYLYHGYMNWNEWYYIPLLLIAAWLGTYTGKYILTRISQKSFERIVLIFTGISGFALVIKEIV